jgi:hypothetical protein
VESERELPQQLLQIGWKIAALLDRLDGLAARNTILIMFEDVRAECHRSVGKDTHEIDAAAGDDEALEATTTLSQANLD